MHNPTFTLACVVDNHPRFHTELALWAHCVDRYLPKENFIPIVYFVNSIHPELGDWLGAKGISCKTMTPVVPGSPHCNKIAVFLDDHDTDYTIATDTDLFFVHDPSCLFGSDRIRAAPNNHCRPPGWVFQEILAACGLNRPYRPSLALYRNPQGLRETHLNNISAGIIGLPRPKARPFAVRWRYWAEWLVANRSLLRQWSIHVDQVAFCLAAEDVREDVEFLPAQVNTILHSLDEISTVWAFHLTSVHIPQFAHVFNEDRTMNATGLSEGVSLAIDRLNRCIADAARDILAFPETRHYFYTFLNPQWWR